MGNPHQRSLFLKGYTQGRRYFLEWFVKDCTLWVGPHTRERTSNNEELLWTHHNPYSHHFCIIQGMDEVKELRTLSLGRRLGGRDLLLEFLWFVCLSQFYFIFILKLIKLIFPKLSLFCHGGNWQTSDICLFILTFKFAILFCPLSCCWGGAREQLGEHLEVSQSQPTTIICLNFHFHIYRMIYLLYLHMTIRG